MFKTLKVKWLQADKHIKIILTPQITLKVSEIMLIAQVNLLVKHLYAVSYEQTKKQTNCLKKKD